MIWVWQKKPAYFSAAASYIYIKSTSSTAYIKMAFAQPNFRFQNPRKRGYPQSRYFPRPWFLVRWLMIPMIDWFYSRCNGYGRNHLNQIFPAFCFFRQIRHILQLEFLSKHRIWPPFPYPSGCVHHGKLDRWAPAAPREMPIVKLPCKGQPSAFSNVCSFLSAFFPPSSVVNEFSVQILLGFAKNFTLPSSRDQLSTAFTQICTCPVRLCLGLPHGVDWHDISVYSVLRSF